ncbi:hypothetical protein HDU97_004645 [Phlyctochytrium planicorne]|nr:hypothetical protein HDU97_004645 [Phlyctochytrium planicorne]
MANSEERLNKRLDTELETLESQFGHILKASFIREQDGASDKTKIKDKYKINQESQLMDGATANLVHSAQSLLSLTSEIRQALLLNDFKALNFGMKHRMTTLHHQNAASKSTLLEVQKEVVELREEMAQILATSKYVR